MGHNISESDVANAVQKLRAQGISDAQIAEVIGALSYGQTPMSTSDGSYRAESQPDAPGVYVSAEQKLQDNYAGGIAAQQVQQTSGMQADPLYFLKTPDHNVGVVMSSSNPNYRVAEPTRTTVNDQGHIVVY